MGTKTLTKEVTVCDICKREIDNGVTYTCLVCEREFCWSCAESGRDGAYFNKGDLCKECAKKPAVMEVQQAYRAMYWALQKKERDAFGNIKKVKS